MSYACGAYLTRLLTLSKPAVRSPAGRVFQTQIAFQNNIANSHDTRRIPQNLSGTSSFLYAAAVLAHVHLSAPKTPQSMPALAMQNAATAGQPSPEATEEATQVTAQLKVDASQHLSRGKFNSCGVYCCFRLSDTLDQMLSGMSDSMTGIASLGEAEAFRSSTPPTTSNDGGDLAYFDCPWRTRTAAVREHPRLALSRRRQPTRVRMQTCCG